MWQRKKIFRAAGIAFLVLLVGAGAFTLYLDHRVRTEFEGRRFALPARIYARPLELHAGQRLALPDLEDELRELGYKALIEKPDPAREAEGGWYVRSGERLDVGLRAFVFWDGPQPARQLRLAFEGGTVRALNDTEGREVALAGGAPPHRPRGRGGGAGGRGAAADRRYLSRGKRGPGAGAPRRSAAASREGA